MQKLPTNFSAIVDGFNVTLNKTDEHLSLEAENQSTSNFYQTKITDNQVSELSNNLFADTTDLYDCLTTGLEGLTNDTRVAVSKNAEVHVTCKTLIANKERTFKFTIKLEELKLEPVERFEKQLTKQQAEIVSLKAKITELQTLLYLNSDSLTPAFDSQSTYSSCFALTNNNKTATRNNSNPNNWFAIFAKDIIPKGKLNKFSVRLEGPDKPNIYLGIASDNFKATQNITSALGVYSISLSNNAICINGQVKTSNICDAPNKGCIISMIIDFPRAEVVFKINEFLIYCGRIEASQLNNNFYPFATMLNDGASVSFI